MKHRILAAAALTVAAVAVMATPAQADPVVPSPCGNAVNGQYGQFEGKFIGAVTTILAQELGFSGQRNPGTSGAGGIGFPDPVGKVICNPVVIY